MAEVQFDVGNLSCHNAADLPRDFGTNPEGNLRTLATETTQELISQLFNLPTEAAVDNVGRLASLPFPLTNLPREKPIPEAKHATKWEEFAKLKGIVKRKKSKLTYDEQQEGYVRRHGYKRANDHSNDWIMESAPGDESNRADPWLEEKKAKKARVEKNSKQQQSNLGRAEGKRVPGQIDLTTAVTSKSLKRKQKAGKPKHHVDVALEIAQKSTASQGKFDRKRLKEPKLKLPQNESKKKMMKEKNDSLALLDKIMGKS